MLRAAAHPFSRSISDWRKDPELLQLPEPGTNSFFTPRGEPKKWTEAQRTTHEEGKAAWIEAEIEKANDLAKEQARPRRGATTVKTVRVRQQYRRVLAEIDGRRGGQPAVAKNVHGRPLVPQPPMTQEDGREEPHIEAAAAKLWCKVVYTVLDKHDGDAGVKPVDEAVILAAGTRLWRRVMEEQSGKRSQGTDVSKTPVKTKGPFVVKFNERGEKIPHDYWPSKWRKIAAEYLNDERINKTVSKLGV